MTSWNSSRESAARNKKTQGLARQRLFLRLHLILWLQAVASSRQRLMSFIHLVSAVLPTVVACTVSVVGDEPDGALAAAAPAAAPPLAP